MIKVTPVRELGDPRNLDATPKATEKTVLFSDLSPQKQQAAIDAAMKLGDEICIVTVDDAIVVVKGYNDEHEQINWGPNQPLRYALFNAKQHSIGFPPSRLRVRLHPEGQHRLLSVSVILRTLPRRSGLRRLA